MSFLIKDVSDDRNVPGGKHTNQKLLTIRPFCVDTHVTQKWPISGENVVCYETNITWKFQLNISTCCKIRVN